MNQDLQSKNFGILLTRKISLRAWEKLGILEREVKPYLKLAQVFKNIYIFTYGSKEEDEKYAKIFPENVKVLYRPRFFSYFFYSLVLPFWHRDFFKNIQILKTNQMDGAWAGVLAKKIFGLKLVARCGYEWLFTLKRQKRFFLKIFFAEVVEKFVYKNADRIILTSASVKNFVLENFDVKSEKIDIIPNYIDTDLFKPSSSADKNNQNRIIFVGRLEAEKNLVNLILSLVGLDVLLVLVGSGPLEARLRELAKEKKLAVAFLGNIPQAEVARELALSRIFILPSLYEGNPKALLEAMASGLACIGSDVAGINTLIKDGENGILCGTDVSSIRGAIVRVLKDADLRFRIGINARKKVESENSFVSCFEKELSIYKFL